MEKEVFRAGTWIDSSGKSRTYTEKDLDSIVAKFNNDSSHTEAGRKVPLCIGHPSDNSPAFGYVEKVWRSGKSLLAKFSDVPDMVRNWIKQKTYEATSIAHNGDMSLRHIAILGGVPPAVPGLDGWKFEQSNADIITLSQFKGDSNMELQEAMNKIAVLEADKAKLTEENHSFKQQVEELSKTGEAVSKDALSFKQKADELAVELKKKENELLDSADFAFVDRLISEKKVRPVERDIVIMNLKAHRGNSEPMSFKMADGKEEQKTAIEIYKFSLEGMPAQIQEGQLYTDGRKSAGNEDSTIVEKVQKIMKDDNLSYAQASTKVFQIYPNLNTTEVI